MENKKMEEFTADVLDKFAGILTDKVFRMIEKDRELMYEYLHLVASHGNVAAVNSTIAKAIKQRFVLDNRHERNEEPKSRLIQSYEMFE